MKRIVLLAGGMLALAALSSAQGPNESLPGWGPIRWVWDQAEAHQHAQTNEPRYLRRGFELPGKPDRAELRITADNHYVVWINGRQVGSDGEWKTVEKYDVAKHLVPGKNVLAIEARNQGGVAGVIAHLAVRTADGKEIIVGTDPRTRITRKKPDGWLQIEFDDSSWEAAVVLGDAAIGPWNVVQGKAAGPRVPGDQVRTDKRLPAHEQIKHVVVPPDFEVELVAAEPLVSNPVTMTVDEKGRIYVSESHTYRYGPKGSPVSPYANPVVRLDRLPDGKGYRRTIVADGFDDPVMGMAIRDGKLWLTANNYLYLYDLDEDGKATNRRTLVIDKNKAWNPFGLYVLEFGPDGLLYLSVGNHAIALEGPTNQMSSRGNSGIIVRMQPDGSQMERLVHGLRVPYSFEFDPFGQLWLLSNGEGNPNRFVRVLEGIDYHCYSRPAVDNNWLAGLHPLAPPSFELPRGAHTQLLRYYGAAYPNSYQGSLFLDNWGAHGFGGINRAVFRFVPDARGNIVQQESFVSCTDPHFRPSHVVLDPDGNMLVADWYGRDDESDLTGRIWRIRYTGKDRPALTHALDGTEWARDEYAVAALGSPSHTVREKAVREMLQRGNAAVARLRDHAAGAAEPLGAAQALWVLVRIGSPEARSAIVAGARHADWKVRRLALQLLRRYQVAEVGTAARMLAADDDPAVRVEAALAQAQPAERVKELATALRHGAARDPHLRYQAAWHLARDARADTFTSLLMADDEAIRLAGLIALDVAVYEDFPSKSAAQSALASALEKPGPIDLGLLLKVVQLDGDNSVLPALEKLAAREDLPVADTARALMVLRAKGGLSASLGSAAGKRFVRAVADGSVPITTPADQVLILELLETEGPTEFALKYLAGQIRGTHPQVRPAAQALARKFGPRSAPLAEQLWPSLFDPKTKPEDALDQLATLSQINVPPSQPRWRKLLATDDALLRTDTVRWWRSFKGQPAMTDLLVQQAPELLKKDPGLKEDLAMVYRHLEIKAGGLADVGVEQDKAVLARYAAQDLANLTPAERPRHALLGRQVFERTGCVKCHTTVMQNTLLAPSLKGIAAQKIDYLIESVLFPSKIIKTGFEAEAIVTKDGKVHTGLVREEGAFLRLLNLDRDLRIARAEVEERAVQKVSIMPEGQEVLMSRREFVDLIAYLMTLK